MPEDPPESLDPAAAIAALAADLKALRVRQGMTQRKVATVMNVNPSTVCVFEQGNCVSLRTVCKYAAAIGARISVELRSSNSPPPGCIPPKTDPITDEPTRE